MTISDLIARLTRIMKENSPTLQVKIGCAYNTTENPFDYFEVKKPVDGKDVYLIPSNTWDRADLKRFAQREAQQ